MTVSIVAESWSVEAGAGVATCADRFCLAYPFVIPLVLASGRVSESWATFISTSYSDERWTSLLRHWATCHDPPLLELGQVVGFFLPKTSNAAIREGRDHWLIVSIHRWCRAPIRGSRAWGCIHLARVGRADLLLVLGGRARDVDYAGEDKTTTSTGWSRPRIATRSWRPPGYSDSISE